MNLPEIVSKSFEELRNQPGYIAIVNLVVEQLSKLNSPLDRARMLHRLVDTHNEEVFSHPLVQQMSPCKMGCTACCHTQVSVTEDEAILLVKRINDGFKIDENRLKLQMVAKDDPAAYFQIDYKNRKCIFLNDQGACGVYEDRPAVCRTNAVLGAAEQCDTSKEIRPTRLVRTPKSNMAIYGAYLSSKSSGVLPHMVGKLLGFLAD